MKKPTIMIVEDDGILAIHLQDLLLSQGYNVLKPVSTGEDALREEQNQKPDLVLMDIELGGEINGISTAKQMGELTDTPIIFLTGFSQNTLLQQAKLATPYGYLVKPVPERELAATIEMALYKHKIDHQIKLSEAKFRALIEQASDGIFLSDKSGNYIEVNSAGCAMLGYTRAEILNLNMKDIIAPENLTTAPLRTKEMLNGAVLRTERILIRKDGSHLPVEISGKMLENGNLQAIVRDISERKLAEKQLKLSNERLDLATRGTHLGVWDWDIVQNILVWDDTMYQLYGIQKDAFAGAYEAWLKGLHPDDVAVNEEISAQARHGEREYDTEFRVIWQDGSIHWLKALGLVIRAEDGTPLRMTGINFDITKRKEAEDVAQSSELRLHSLLEISQYQAKNSQELLDFALEKAIQLTESKIGYIYFYDETKKEFTLNTWSKDVLPQCSVLEKFSVYQLEKTGFWGEAVRQRKALINNDFQASHPLKKGTPDGHVVMNKFLTIPIFVNQTIVAVVGVANKAADYDATDELQLSLMMDSVWRIVEQTKAHEQLHLESAALNAAANAIVITNKDGGIEWANPAFTRLTGFTLGEAAGINPRDLVKSGQHSREFYQNMWDTILAGKVWHGEMINRRKDGTLYSEEMTITPLLNPDGEIKQFIAIKQDITERVNAEETRRKLEEKFYKAFQTSPDSININRLSDGLYLDINEGFLALTGYVRDEVLGKTSLEINIWANPQDRQRLVDGLRAEGKVSNLKAPFRAKNGEIRTCLMSASVLEVNGEACILSITRDISERDQADEALNAANQRTENIITAANIGTWEWNIQTGDQIVNEEWAQIIGYTSAELTPISKTTYENLVHPEDLKHAIEVSGQHFAGKTPFNDYEIRMKHKDGSWVWVHSRGRVFTRTDDGKPLLMFGTHTDITERKNTEEARRQLEEKFTKAFQTSPDAIAITQLEDGLFIDINDGFQNISGYNPEEVIGKTSTEVSIWFDPAERQNVVHELKEKGVVSNMEMRFRIKNGNYLTCLFSATFIEIDGQKCILSITRDISERKQIEETLRYSEERYHMLFEEMAEGFALHEIILDEDGNPKDYRFLDANPAYEKQTGLKKKEIIGRTVKDVIPTIEDYWIQEFCQVALTGNTLHYENFVEALGKWYQVTAFSPKFGQFAVTVEDITERKQSDKKVCEQLEELRRWYKVTLGRENRIMELKQEVNRLHQKAGLPPRYANDSTQEQNHE